MKTILVEVQCPTCGHLAYVKSEQFIIPEFNRKHRDAIIEESFFAYCCPVCKTKLEFIHDCLYHDHAHQLLVVLCRDQKDILVETAKEPIRRLVKTPQQLKETILIFESHLHDIPVAYMKGQLIQLFKKRNREIKQLYFHDYDQETNLVWFDVYDMLDQLDTKAVSFQYYIEAKKKTDTFINDHILQEVTISQVMNAVNCVKKDC